MKKVLIAIFFLHLIYCSTSQSIYFNKRIVLTNYSDVCRGILPMSNGYFVAGGHGPGYIVYLSYLDSIGTLKWTVDYKTTGYSYFFGLSGSLFLSPDKYFAICGGRTQFNGYGVLIKVDSSGNKKWEREYKFYDNTVINSGTITLDSGYVLTGDTDTISPRTKYLLIKADSLGIMQWFKTFTDNHPNRNYAGKSVIQTPDSGYCLGGGGYWNPPGEEYHSIVEIIKTDSLGDEKWKKTYGNPLNCNSEAMICLSADSCIVVSYTIGYSGIPRNNSQAYITKLGLDGIEKWNKKIGNLEPNNWVSWIQTLTDGGFIISGSHYDKDTINKVKGWLFKLNKNGDSLWYREYVVISGINDVNQLWQVTSTPDGGFAAAGSLYPLSAGGTQDIWVFKTDSVGCLVHNCDGTGLTEFNPNAGAQMLVFPNPFTNAFAINYNIPKENTEAVFQLYDIYGKLVYQIGLTTSINQLQVVASALKAGMYVGCLVVDGVVVSTKKIVKNEF